MRLRYVQVEYKVCSEPECLQANLARLQANLAKLNINRQLYIRNIETKYEGDTCPDCGTPFHPTRARKVTYDRLILVDVYPPYYEPVHRIRCSHKRQHCTNLNLCAILPGIPLSPKPDEDEEWDNLFDVPQQLQQLVATYQTKQWPDAELEPLAKKSGMSVSAFRNALENQFKNLRNQLTCPLCQAVGTENINWRPSLVWVRNFQRRTIDAADAAAVSDFTDGIEENDEFANEVAENASI